RPPLATLRAHPPVGFEARAIVVIAFVLRSCAPLARAACPTLPGSGPAVTSQAKTMARTMDLHRVPLLAARHPDAAPVKRVGGSVRREVRGPGDDPSHGLSQRSRGVLLGFADALKMF